VARAFPLEHYLVAPLFASGKLIGTLNLGRRSRDAPFATSDLLAMGAIAGQISASLDRLERNSTRPVPVSLTSREHEIARLVSKGLTNDEIGELLGISGNGVKQALKRIFVKADVSTRAELVAVLASTT
jgi:DNA-binding CsgD family transcriptional regulator